MKGSGGVLMGGRVLAVAFGLLLVLSGASAAPAARTMDATDLSRAREMLHAVRLAVRDYFHDPGFKGLDLDAHFGVARERMGDAVSMEQAYRIIADTLAGLDDPHTYFIPPPVAAHYDPGWDLLIVGDDAYVSVVRPGSDAVRNGMRRGDRVLLVGGRAPSRHAFWSLRQPDYVLSPRPMLDVRLQSAGKAARDVTIRATVTPRPGSDTAGHGHGVEPSVTRPRAPLVTDIAGVRVWTLDAFDPDATRMERAARQAIGRASAMVLDLRGNGGGAIEGLVELTRHFFRREVHIAEPKGRRRLRPLVAQGRRDAFAGELIVLVDSATASSAEIFARVIQIEQRGIVVGDRTAACVMQARTRMASIPLIGAVLPFGVSIAEADIIMRDGRSLQGTGVTPDVVSLPTGDDLAHGRDPVLAHALGLLGLSIEAAEAGRLGSR
jgi:C-terminal processing protease CtpA/Prc